MLRCILLTPFHAMHNDTGVQGKALYFASKGVDPDWVELLLEQDAALDFIDGDGKTALDVAANREIKALLKVIAFSRVATSTHKHTQARTSTHKHAQAHTSTHKHTQAHTSTHKHTHTHTHTHTHIHTHTLSP